MLNDLNNAVGVDNGIVDYSLAPAVAELHSISIDYAVTIDGVRPLPLTVENAIAGVNAIAGSEGVECSVV